MTDAPVSSTVTPWDGRGPAGGFEFGEVEDYSLEWMPVGQMFAAVLPERDPGRRAPTVRFASAAAQQPQETIQAPFVGDLVQFSCPESIGAGEEVTCEIAGPPPDTVTVVCVPDGQSGGAAAGAIHLSVDDSPMGSIEEEACTLEAELASGTLTLALERAAPGAALLVFASAQDRGLRRGSPGVEVTGGARIVVK